MKFTSKEQFDAIQYTSIEVIRDFLPDALVSDRKIGLFVKLGYSEVFLFPEHWLLFDGHTFQTLSDVTFKERYVEPFTQEEKDFILKALTHVTSNSDDTHARVEDNVRIARIKQQILDKL